MPKQPPLRVVTDETAELPEPKSLKEAVERGERALLVAMRAKALAELDNGVPPAYLAPVMRQVRELDREIRSLDERAKQEAEDDGVVPDEEWDSEAL